MKSIFYIAVITTLFASCKKKEYITEQVPADPQPAVGTYHGMFTTYLSFSYSGSSIIDTMIEINAYASNQVTDNFHSSDLLSSLHYHDSIVPHSDIEPWYDEEFSSGSSGFWPMIPNAFEFFTNSKWQFSSSALGNNTFFDISPLPSYAATIPSTISLSVSTTLIVNNIQNCQEVVITFDNGNVSRLFKQGQNTAVIHPVEFANFSAGPHSFSIEATKTTDTLINNKRYLFKKVYRKDYNPVTFVN